MPEITVNAGIKFKTRNIFSSLEVRTDGTHVAVFLETPSPFYPEIKAEKVFECPTEILWDLIKDKLINTEITTLSLLKRKREAMAAELERIDVHLKLCQRLIKEQEFTKEVNKN